MNNNKQKNKILTIKYNNLSKIKIKKKFNLKLKMM